MALDRILRETECYQSLFGGAGSIGIENEVPVGILPAGRPDGGHEVGIVHVYDFVRFRRGRIPSTLGIEHLVEGLEQEPLPAGCELGGYLVPQRAITLADGLVDLPVGPEPACSGRAGIMVYVEDAVHALVEDIPHDFLDPGHPGRIDIVTLPGGHVPVAMPFAGGILSRGHGDNAHVRIPGHGHAYGIEAGLLEHMYERARGDGLSPRGLIVCRSAGSECFDPHVIDRAAVGIEGVAEIPAYAHVSCGHSSLLPICRVCGILRNGIRHPSGKAEADGRRGFLVLPVTFHGSFRKGEDI